MARVVSGIARGSFPAERSCRGKVRHTNALTARRHLGDLIRKGSRGWLVIYDCEHCGGLHIGHSVRPAPAQPDQPQSLERKAV